MSVLYYYKNTLVQRHKRETYRTYDSRPRPMSSLFEQSQAPHQHVLLNIHNFKQIM